MNFGEALEEMKIGNSIRRKGWGGDWRLFKDPVCKQANLDSYDSSFQFKNGLIVATLKDNGGCAPAQPYQADLLADDWEVIHNRGARRTELQLLQHDLLSTKYTTVLHENNFEYNAPHFFQVYADVGEPEPRLLNEIQFQKGPIKEVGVNGVMNEDLISMVISRLEHFQDSEFACYENEMAGLKLEEALLWLRKRTMGRENRGVEGTHKL